jgi:hypothetical protein
VIVEPVHQRQVVGQAPEQGHGQVGVGVDQAGHDDAAGCVDGGSQAGGRHIRHAAASMARMTPFRMPIHPFSMTRMCVIHGHQGAVVDDGIEIHVSGSGSHSAIWRASAMIFSRSMCRSRRSFISTGH